VSVTQILEDSRVELEQSVTGLSNELCSRTPADGGWSITQIIEHLVTIEKRVLALLRTKLPEQEQMPDTSTVEKDAEVVRQVRSRASKINAPEVTHPSGRYTNCRDALTVFGAARQRTLTFALSNPQYLRGRLLPHPVLGPLDGCQWVLAVGAHTQRHVQQIEEIKAASVS
jgi:Cys-tRNA synthase (O-phospho-L-seryl-tRNA:Cys-tRNA synthase)